MGATNLYCYSLFWPAHSVLPKANEHFQAINFQTYNGPWEIRRYFHNYYLPIKGPPCIGNLIQYPGPCCLYQAPSSKTLKRTALLKDYNCEYICNCICICNCFCIITFLCICTCIQPPPLQAKRRSRALRAADSATRRDLHKICHRLKFEYNCTKTNTKKIQYETEISLELGDFKCQLYTHCWATFSVCLFEFVARDWWNTWLKN